MLSENLSKCMVSNILQLRVFLIKLGLFVFAVVVVAIFLFDLFLN